METVPGIVKDLSFKNFKHPEIKTRLGERNVLFLKFILLLGQLFMNRSKMCHRRKVTFRMLSKSIKSVKIKHLKLMGD